MLTKSLAFLKRDLLENFSYKSAALIDALSIFSQVLVFFFIAKFLGGKDYFPYVLTGIAFAGYQSAALSSFALSIHREIGTGTLEAILLTRTSVYTVLFSTVIWNFIFTSLKVLVYFAAGMILFDFDFSKFNAAGFFLSFALTISAMMALGVLSAGCILVLRRGDPVTSLMNNASRFLSGVYFPIQVLPAWIQPLSYLLPLTYALEALRRSLFNGDGIHELAGHLSVLFIFSVILWPCSLLFFRWAFHKARKEGTLSLP